MFAKDFSLTRLFDRYAPLLTEKQQTAFSLYYNEDFSLSEIAEHTGTSRQAVRSLLQKTAAELLRFEEALHLTEKEEKLSALARALEGAEGEDVHPIVRDILAITKE